MPVTTISNRFCQRERLSPVARLRVMSHEPPANTSLSPHVNAMVALSFTNPRCQKISWSGVRRMTGLPYRAAPDRVRGLVQPQRNESGRKKPEEAHEGARPPASRDNVEPSQHDTHPQQEAATEPERGVWRCDALTHRPPQSTEERAAEHSSGRPGQHQHQSVIHHYSRPAWLCPPWRPSATRSHSQPSVRQPAVPESRNGDPRGDGPATAQARRPAASERPPTTRRRP